MSSYRWYRPVLTMVMIGAVVWFWSTRFDELRYHTLGRDQVTAIGDAQAYEGMKDQIPVNSLVSVTGILGNNAATLSGLRTGSLRYGRFQVRHLLGSKLYIEYDEAKYHSSFSPFNRVSVTGRLTSFGTDSEIGKVRDFFNNRYRSPVADDAMLVVVDELPKTQFRYIIAFLISALLVAFSIYSSVRAFKKPPPPEPEED